METAGQARASIGQTQWTLGDPVTELGHSEKLARTLIVAAFKVTLPSVSTRVEGIADIADVISERSGNWRSRNTLRRRLEDATDLLTERLAALEAVEFRQLPPAEQRLAIEGICRAIDTLEISRVTIIKQGLEFHKLLHELQPEAERQWRTSLLGGTGGRIRSPVPHGSVPVSDQPCPRPARLRGRRGPGKPAPHAEDL